MSSPPLGPSRPVSSSVNSTNMAASPPRYAARKPSLVERATAVIDAKFPNTGMPLRRIPSNQQGLPTNNATGASSALSNAPLYEEYPMNPDDYELGLPIGFGSSAAVYIAKCIPLNKTVAIKMIDLDLFERNQIDELRREIQIMSLSRHPNLLPVQGSFVSGSKLYIITPFLSAGSCLDIMKNAFPDGLEEIAIATILKQTLQGLEYLHRNGLIHRDVKAGNLLMDDDGLVQLADFGVSSSLMETGERKGLRKTFVGTPCWMAPEVMEQSGYDYKADIWSFGITALELATGHAPFAQYPPIKVLMLTLQNDPPTLDRDNTKHRYSKTFKEMIDTCLQKDPARRPTAEKLLQHPFFKVAKKGLYLAQTILKGLPPINQRHHHRNTLLKKEKEARGVSWDFSSEKEEEPASGVKKDVINNKRHVAFSVNDDVTITPRGSEDSQYPRRSEDSQPLRRSEDSQRERRSSETSSNRTDETAGPKKSRFIVDIGNSHDQQSAPNQAASVQFQTLPSHPPLPHLVSQQPSLSTASLSNQEIKKGRFSVMESSSAPQSLENSPAMMRTQQNATSGEEIVGSQTADLSNTVPSLGRVKSGSELQRQSRFAVSSESLNIVPANTPVPAQSHQAPETVPMPIADKRGRFEVSAFENITPSYSSSYSGDSTTVSPNLSPMNTGINSNRQSLSAPPPTVLRLPSASGSDEGVRTNSTELQDRLDAIMRQNEQQKLLLNELLSAMGKTGSVSFMPSGSGNLPLTGEGVSQAILEHQGNLERQLNAVTRNNETLRKENEALRQRQSSIDQALDLLRKENMKLKADIEGLHKNM